MIKLIRKRIDVDGLTKVSDQITSRMLQKERAYKQQLETLHDHMRRMQRFVYALIHINNSQVNPKLPLSHQNDIVSFLSTFLHGWKQYPRVMLVVLVHRRFPLGKQSIVQMLMSFVGCRISMLKCVTPVIRNFNIGLFLVNITVEVGKDSSQHSLNFFDSPSRMWKCFLLQLYQLHESNSTIE